MVRIEHQLKFLLKCKEEKKTPRRLKIQKKNRLMDSPGSHHSKATIQKNNFKAEQEGVGALVNYHRKVKNDTLEEIESNEVSIEKNMDDIRKADMTPVVRHFQEIMERGESTLISSLKEKRNKKLLQFTSCSHTPPSLPLPTPHTSSHIFPFYAHTNTFIIHRWRRQI